MKIAARIKSKLQQLEAVVETDNEAKTITIDPKPTGYGAAIKGGELLMLSLATCYCNSLFMESAKSNLSITEVEVIFTGEFGEEGGSNFEYTVNVTSTAPEKDIEALILLTDKTTSVQNIVRSGIAIALNRQTTL